MKIARVTENDGAPFWAVVDPDAGTARALRGHAADWAPAVTRGETPGLDAERALDGLRLLAPLEPTSRVIGAGATYARHIEGLGLKMPERPAGFLRTVESVVGPGEEIRYPAVTRQLDYEAELVVVFGAAIDGDPMQAVLGYTVGNEVSARDLQFGGSVTGMDLFSAKALDGTAPIGPWIVTRDEFGDGSPDLALRLTVDGEVRQDARTSLLAWPLGEIIAYIDARCAVRPGDVLFTGTCEGVGHEDGRYLEPGQEVVVSLEGVGELRNVVGAQSS